VPLTTGGQLAIVASRDLGALGAKDGAPVNCEWVPGIAPLMLPWLVILGLLALKPNRCAAAWLIWLPVGGMIAISQAVAPCLPDEAASLCDTIAGLLAGLSAVWLLPDYLRRGHRILTFLCILLAMAGFSALSFVSQQSLNMTNETISVAVALAVGVMTTTLALSLCGLICRGRYRPIGLYVWLLLLLEVIWLGIIATIYLIITLAQGGVVQAGEVFLPVLAVAAGNFAVLLPFLILSSASPFYRERLKALLHVKVEPPPMPAPLPSAPLPEGSPKA
jgi:hypothetical protein